MEGKYKKLMSNTLLFALSNFSSKLLSLFLQPYITHAMGQVKLSPNALALNASALVIFAR